MSLQNKLEGLRSEATDRILERLRELNHEERHIYLEAYSDALVYVHDFLREIHPELLEVIDEYRP